MLSRWFCAAMAVTATGVAQAAGPIETDGPDYVESSETVGKARFQIEIDYETVRDRPTGVRRASAMTLLRFGLTENLEARIQSEDLIRYSGTAAGVRPDAGGEIAWGLKWHSHDRDVERHVPSVSWILHLNFPRQTELGRGASLRTSLRAVMTWELSDDWSVGLMPGVVRNVDEAGKHFAAASFGVVVGKRLNEQWRVFAEFASPQIAPARDGGVISTWNLGAAYLLSNDWQLGARISQGANGNTPSNAVMFEVAARY